jgi:heme/copper-type cytochrome/quinol oxidase subunit 1
MFFLGFSGLPRRIHDFPAVFLGWQGLATCGHFLTLLGLVFFFLGILDSNIEKKQAILLHFGIPKWTKRIHFYNFKIKYNQYWKEISSELPNVEVRTYIIDNFFNEYETFSQ